MKTSFLHFRRALVQDKLEDERFRISLIPVESIADIHDSEELPVDREQILDSSNDQYTLNFVGFLKVIYRKRPDREFSNQYAYEEESSRRQVSYLKLNKDEPVVLRNNGRMELPGLATFGYWYWERIGDILPENYHPDR